MSETAELHPSVGAIILAAGASVRMGQLKQLLPLQGQPLVRRVACAVCEAQMAQVVVVVGSRAEEVINALRGLPLEIVLNRHWAQGMSTSLRAGLRALRPDVQAAIVVLADQPGISAGLLQELVSRYHARRARIVAPFYRGRRGNPVLFDRALFSELEAVTGDQGGRELLAQHRSEVLAVELDDPAVLIDLDTWQDYEASGPYRGQL